MFSHTWLYTTNHRRISIKYFLFIFLSASIGTFLASLIRSEMAYPGAGVLYGDSIQYLTVVTGHGVVMVFFMIIPLLFGGFANLLLPLQLGVRDVASPRLNSSSFWFLPGGLIMLGHLICTEKKYHKLNCFNLIEAQALLKQQFFLDLLRLETLLIGIYGISAKYYDADKINDPKSKDIMSHFNFTFTNIKSNYTGFKLNKIYFKDAIVLDNVVLNKLTKACYSWFQDPNWVFFLDP